MAQRYMSEQSFSGILPDSIDALTRWHMEQFENAYLLVDPAAGRSQFWVIDVGDPIDPLANYLDAWELVKQELNYSFGVGLYEQTNTIIWDQYGREFLTFDGTLMVGK